VLVSITLPLLYLSIKVKINWEEYFMVKIVQKLTGDAMPVSEFPARNFHVENDLTKEIRRGDIIAVRVNPKSFSSVVISHFTSSPYSHVEVHLTDGYDISANSTGVGYVDLFKHSLKEGYRVDVFRTFKELGREKELMLLGKASKAVLLPYDYTHLILFPFLLSGSKLSLKKSGNDAYICSELTAWLYNEIGIPAVQMSPEAVVAPADFGYSALLGYVGTFEKGIRLPHSYRNEFFDDEKTAYGRFFSSMLKLLSSKDEFYKGLYLNRDKMNNENK
jgi:hypothetical protein